MAIVRAKGARNKAVAKPHIKPHINFATNLYKCVAEIKMKAKFE